MLVFIFLATILLYNLSALALDESSSFSRKVFLMLFAIYEDIIQNFRAANYRRR